LTDFIKKILKPEEIAKEKTHWEQIKLNPSVDNINMYLATYPSGKYSNEAIVLKEQLIASDKLSKEHLINDNRAWDLAEILNTEDAYLEYINNYPKGVHFEKALKSISTIKEDEKYWTENGNSKESKIYDEYLKKFPNGKYALIAKERLSDISEWKNLGSYKYKYDLEGYLEKFPNGIFAQTAQEGLGKIEDDDWKEFNDSEYGLNLYLDRYPNGKYAEDAKISLGQKIAYNKASLEIVHGNGNAVGAIPIANCNIKISGTIGNTIIWPGSSRTIPTSIKTGGGDFTYNLDVSCSCYDSIQKRNVILNGELNGSITIEKEVIARIEVVGIKKEYDKGRYDVNMILSKN
jgi:outer membrane protein assembly factor BamD (BamD/ComL family)